MKKNVLVFSFMLATLSVSLDAYGFRKFLDQFSDHYDANNISVQNLTDERSCGLCHVRAGGGGKRTPYGEDFSNVSLDEGKGFPGIEFLDSDSDGFINLEEIYLQTSPGHQDSAPTGRIELSLLGASTLLVKPAVSCAQIELLAFGFQFADNASTAILANVSAGTEVGVKGTQGAILAKCAQENLSGSLQK